MSDQDNQAIAADLIANNEAVGEQVAGIAEKSGATIAQALAFHDEIAHQQAKIAQEPHPAHEHLDQIVLMVQHASLEVGATVRAEVKKIRALLG